MGNGSAQDSMDTVSDCYTVNIYLKHVLTDFVFKGMARIFTCVPGLVKLMAGEPWEATGLPECFQISQDRINRLTRDIKSRL